MSASSPRLSVVIASTPRSGSYLLCDLLQATGHVPQADEWLTDVGLDSRRMAYQLPTDTHWTQVLAEMPAREMNSAAVFAIKTAWEQFHSRLIELSEDGLDGLPEAAAKAFPNPKYIWIRRRDLVGQCVSWAKAMQTGQWRNRLAPGGAVSAAPLQFSAHDIFWSSYFIHDLEAGWTDFFEKTADAPCIVFYEDLVADPQGAITRICEFIGLPAPPEIKLPGKPQRDATNAEWKNRYNQLLNGLTDESGDPNPIAGKFLELPEMIEMQTSEVRILEVRVQNDSDQAWNPRLSRTGLRGSIIRVAGLSDEPILGEVHEKVLPGEEVSVPVRLVAPAEAGDYLLEWSLQDSAIGELTGQACPQQNRLRVIDSPGVAAAKQYFGGYKVLKTGWAEVPGFGFFLDDCFPFVFHKEHGWWWIDLDVDKDRGVRIHDVHMEWLRVSPNSPAVLYRESDAHELRLIQSDGSMRTFEDLTEGLQFQVPVCREQDFNKKQT